MDDARSPHFFKAHPVLLRLILWPLLLGLIAWETAQQPARIGHAEFRLAGNRTNLHAILVAQPSADKQHGKPGAMFFRRLDATLAWSPQAERPQDEDLLHTVAWQEDLLALYASGGMFFVGPSLYGYQGPPIVGWRPVAAAVDQRTLMVVGLDPTDGKPVFHRLSQKDQWGTGEPVGIVADWTPETARTARAAVRSGQFHVVWTDPAPAGPLEIGDTPGGRVLRFAWREPEGQWKGPFAAEFRDAGQRNYLLTDHPVSVAACDDDLAMLAAVRPADQPDATQLVLVRFYPSDGQWHVEWEASLPIQPTDSATAFALARFRDGFAAAAYDGRNIRVATVATTAGQATQIKDLPPVTMVLPIVPDSGGSYGQTVLMVAAMVLVMVLAVRGYRQRVIPRPGADGPDEQYRRRAAMAAAYQVEKFMYLPVLIRRCAAFALDMVVVFLITVLIVLIVEGSRRPDMFLAGRPDDVKAWLNQVAFTTVKVAFTLVLMVYFTASELLLGRTLGKRLFGLRIVDPADCRPAWWRVIDRNLMRPLELLIPIALLVILWTPRSQRLGDLLGGTRVVMASQRTDRIAPSATTPRTL